MIRFACYFSGGECKDDFCRTVSKCTDLLPDDKPRYLMGVGFSEDLVVCVALGIDMFDCVFPTRTAVSFIYKVFLDFFVILSPISNENSFDYFKFRDLV